MDDALQALDRFEWERQVLKTPLPSMTKLVALGLATYGNKSGRNAHPGNRVLAEALGLSDRTVERHLGILRDAGLLDRVFRGSAAGRRRLADVYELVVADDLDERLKNLGTPDTRDVCIATDHPTVVTGDRTVPGAKHPTERAEHPTPVTGTPDTEGRSPDTPVAPPCVYTKPVHQEETSSCGDSVAARDGDEIEEGLAALKSLPPTRMQALLDEATAAVGDEGWPAVVRYARDHAGAVA